MSPCSSIFSVMHIFRVLRNELDITWIPVTGFPSQPCDTRFRSAAKDSAFGLQSWNKPPRLGNELSHGNIASV